MLGSEPKTKDFGPKTSNKLLISILKFAGMLGNRGHVLGYILKLMITVTDPLDQMARSSK